jgi:16S rRNA (cytosine967-C5)-methyltransferase
MMRRLDASRHPGLVLGETRHIGVMRQEVDRQTLKRAPRRGGVRGIIPPMHPNALLDLTARLVHEVLKLDAPADSIVSYFFRSHKELGQRERHALAETAYAVLRQRLLWAHLAQSGHGPLDRRLAILAWQGEAHVLKKAVTIDEAGWLARTQKIDRSTLQDKLKHNLPDWLSNNLRDQLGAEGFWALVETLSAGAALDLRVNAVKAKREAVIESLVASGIPAQPTPYAPTGIRIEGKPALQKLPLYIEGQVEVQDEGSQLLALLTGAKRGEMVVDFCAGAGGKTLALGAMMRNTGRLYAFDISGHRLENLKPRLARSGLSNVYATQIAHERDDRIKRLSGKIDRVLVDAPCSGLGTLRRNPDLKWRQSPKAIEELQAKQTAILNSAARLLKPGGRLVYATCSLMPAENEVIANAFSESHPDFTPLDAREKLEAAGVENAESLVTPAGHLRLWPHLHHTDGFYAVAWEKKA